MNGIELYVLGRRLMKLGEEAMPRTGFRTLPSSVQSILVDVSEHPGSSISEIVSRTGFPQSLVSGAVARLRSAGALQTVIDSTDRRRTLVSASAALQQRMARAPSTSIDPVIGRALGIDDQAEIARVIDLLNTVAQQFNNNDLTSTTAS